MFFGENPFIELQLTASTKTTTTKTFAILEIYVCVSYSVELMGRN